MNLSFAKGALASLRRRDIGATLSYSLGRFQTVRRAYGFGVGFLQGQPSARPLPRRGSPLFFPIDLDAAILSLEARSVFAGLMLSDDVVAELSRFAVEAPLRPLTERYTYRYDEVRDGRTPEGDPAILASVVGAEHYPLMRRLAEESQACEIARRYLGYKPHNE